ncbi:MAG: LacI family DNA-binding transcriptional regulator [Synergistaceae bacterium]
MKVTMQDVAKYAGVDKATVSRVIRGDSRISEKTRERVMESVRELNYRPDLNARHLSTNRSGFIGVVLPLFNLEWVAAFVAGFDRAMSNSKYDILFKSTDGDQKRADCEFAKLKDRNVEGIIWCDTVNKPALAVDIPMIAVGFHQEGIISILSRNESLKPNFEVGALTGRLIQRLVTDKPVHVRNIYIEEENQ